MGFKVVGLNYSYLHQVYCRMEGPDWKKASHSYISPRNVFKTIVKLKCDLQTFPVLCGRLHESCYSLVCILSIHMQLVKTSFGRATRQKMHKKQLRIVIIHLDCFSMSTRKTIKVREVITRCIVVSIGQYLTLSHYCAFLYSGWCGIIC